jgi:hypothetical protein
MQSGARHQRHRRHSTSQPMVPTIKSKSVAPSTACDPPVGKGVAAAPPIAGRLQLALAASLVVALLIACVSTAGLILGSDGLYGDPKMAIGAVASTAGVLVPGFLGHDVFNLFVALPLLLAIVWLAWRGSLLALLLWPGVLLYVLYSYTIYLISAPFSVLFMSYAGLVVLGGFTAIGVVTAIDGMAVRQRLAGALPARMLGGLLVVLGFLTVAQDATGALTTALGNGAAASPLARPVWIADLAIEGPVMLMGGLLLWQRTALGYVVGAGLLVQYGLTPVVLASSMIFQALVTAAPVDVATVTVLLAFGAVCFAPLVFFVAGVRAPSRLAAHR